MPDRSCVEQERHQLRLPLPRRLDQRRPPVVVGPRVDQGPRVLQQQPRRRDMPPRRRQDQGVLRHLVRAFTSTPGSASSSPTTSARSLSAARCSAVTRPRPPRSPRPRPRSPRPPPPRRPLPPRSSAPTSRLPARSRPPNPPRLPLLPDPRGKLSTAQFSRGTSAATTITAPRGDSALRPIWSD